MLAIGTNMYGKVDHVPGLFYVATEFMHVNFIPIFPGRSFVILEGTEGEQGFQGHVIGRNLKSILVGYLRPWATLAGVVSSLFFLAGYVRPLFEPATLYVLGFSAVISFALLVWSRRLCHAHPLRALELAKVSGISPERLAQHFVNDETIDQVLQETSDDPVS